MLHHFYHFVNIFSPLFIDLLIKQFFYCILSNAGAGAGGG